MYCMIAACKPSSLAIGREYLCTDRHGIPAGSWQKGWWEKIVVPCQPKPCQHKEQPTCWKTAHLAKRRAVLFFLQKERRCCGRCVFKTNNKKNRNDLEYPYLSEIALKSAAKKVQLLQLQKWRNKIPNQETIS